MRLIDIEPFEKNIEGVDSFHTCVLHFTEFHHTHVNCAQLDTKDIPTVDAEPVRHARWDDSGRYRFQDDSLAIRCTECGCALHEDEYQKYHWNYCPNCGARMDGE